MAADPEYDEIQQTVQALLLKGLKLPEIEAMLSQREAQDVEKRSKLEASNARLGQAIQREEAAPGPSLMHEIGSGLETAGRYVGTAAGDVMDTLTGGGYRKLRDYAIEKTQSPEAVARLRAAESEVQGTPLLKLPEVSVPLPFTDERMNLVGTTRLGDVTSMAGNLIPAGLPGRAMQAGKTVAGAIGAGSAVRRIAGAAAGGAAAGGLQAGTEAAINPRAGFGEFLEDAGAGAATGAIAGGALSAAGEGAGKMSRKLRDDTSALGGFSDHLTALDQANAQGKTKQLGPFRRVVDPEMKELPGGKKGYAVAAQNARDKIVDSGRTELRQTRANYGRQLDEISKAAGDRKVDQSAIVGRFDEMRAENQVNGVAVDDKLDGALDKVSRMMTAKAGLDQFGPIEVPAASFKDVLKTKKAVEKMAEFGMPATPENRPYREIYRILAQEAETLDPTGRLAKLNAGYAETMGKLESANDILFGKEAPEVASRTSARRAATNKLMRAGDDTAAGTSNDEFLEELASLDPEYRQAIDTVRQKKALEATRFGLTQISKSPERWGVAGLIDQNLGAATARVADPALGATEAFGKRAPVNPLVEARRKEREKDAERAKKIRRQ